MRRHPGDQLLIMATDGLWDVARNQDAVDLALKVCRWFDWGLTRVN
jgi:serine/threonine protein phosphatase PrpC